MRAPDNLDVFNAYERKQERLRKKERWNLEDLPFYEEEDEEIEVCFHIKERAEDIEFLEKFLNKYDFAYEKEVF